MQHPKERPEVKQFDNHPVTQEIRKQLNGYVCFYKNRRVEVYATTSYNAQIEAARLLGAKRSYDVSVALAELNGTDYVHTAT